ncbi:DUF222 domain-containing protein [Actinomycetospora cinnamomea]|uniref:Uncharacterized protein DUF222 n=1 Tax=Actinomycetospora cinnamomea TaxID=663609 RepID=A0A2U1FRB6_9PSEU|nr:DUF222 domain-containing protein [Actinomycetospora cinnamomea]PVZ14713.1 uncharacterized protein DUF222 [Actinomycetospora cinnamomea]
MFDSGWVAVAEEPRPSAVPVWSSWRPGPELAAALEATEPVDLADDEGFDAAERLAGWEALAHWATGRLYRETADYTRAREARARGAGRGELASEAVAMEVATLARVAPRTGELRVHQAVTLVEQLPSTLAALEDGRISLGHARVVLEQTELCDPGTARAVDTELWSRPPRDRTPAQLRDLVRRIVTRLDPELLRRRPEHARQQREMRYWSDDHGATGVLQLRLPADEARGVFAVVDAVARSAGDPPGGPRRELTQKRADSARDLILDGATARRDGSGCCSCTTDGATSDSSTGAPADDTPNGAPADDTPNGAPAGDPPDGAPADDTPNGALDGDTPVADEAQRSEPVEHAAEAGAPVAPTPGDDEGDPAGGAPGDDLGPAGAAARPRAACGAEPAREPARGLLTGVPSPVRTEVRVTIGWDVLAGFSERPGELEGHGPIPAPLARRLAGGPDAWWRRLITDPLTGTAAHLDAKRYRPPGSMQEFVRARDVTCAAPGCRVPAARCDLDHVVPYEHHRPGGGAGATTAAGLKPGCRRHHRLKTLSEWSAELGPDPEGGSAPVIIWTSPSGHRWWVRSPALDPPPWDDDAHADRPERGDDAAGHDARPRPGPEDWPHDIDSWRRREAVARPADPRRRAV